MMVYDPDAPGIPAYGLKPWGTGAEETECRYNSGVLCDEWKCAGCGFNPERKRGEKDG